MDISSLAQTTPRMVNLPLMLSKHRYWTHISAFRLMTSASSRLVFQVAHEWRFPLDKCSTDSYLASSRVVVGFHRISVPHHRPFSLYSAQQALMILTFPRCDSFI